LNNNNNTDEGPIISEQEVKKEEEENSSNSTANNSISLPKTDNIPTTPANPKEAKKSDGATEKGNGKKSSLDIHDSISSIKGNKSTVSSSQKKRQPSTTAADIPEKLEQPTTRTGKKSIVNSNIFQIPEDKVGGGENKKDAAAPAAAPASPSPSTKTSENRPPSTSNSSNVSEGNNSNPNPLKFKYFEFNEDNSTDPSYIIDTFLNKLLISSKEDDNDSFIKVYAYILLKINIEY